MVSYVRDFFFFFFWKVLGRASGKYSLISLLFDVCVLLIFCFGPCSVCLAITGDPEICCLNDPERFCWLIVISHLMFELVETY